MNTKVSPSSTPWRILKRLLLTLLLVAAPLLGAQTVAPATLVLDGSTHALEIRTSLHTLLESGSSAGISAIASGARGPFSLRRADTRFALTENNTLWIHLRLERTATAPPDWTLHIPLPYLDQAVLYQTNGKGGWTTQTAGDMTSINQWTHPGLYPEFHLHLPPGAPRDIYLQVRNYKTLGVPLRLANASTREVQREVEYVVIGLVLGTLLMLLGSCAVHMVHSKNMAEGWYVAYTALMVVVIASVTGLSAQWLWPESPAWTNYSYVVLPTLGVGATALFIRHVCTLKVRFPRTDRTLEWFGLASVPLSLLSVLADRASIDNVSAIYMALGPVLALVATVMTWRRGSPVGKWLFLAYLPQGLAVIFLAAQIFNWVPTYWEARHAMVLAVAISVPLLLHALGLRARERREVEDRAKSLPTQDALTGLLVKPVFMTQVQEALHRAVHNRESSAVVLVEVVNYPHLSAVYGQAIAEQCLLRAVVKLHRVLRDVDPAGRVDTARFGLVLEGVSSRQALSERMVGLIASGLIPLPGLKPEVTLQFHMACVLLNEIHPEPDTILDQLGEVLAGIAPRTRRPIRFLEPSTTVPAPLLPESGFGANDSGAFRVPRPQA